MLKFSSRANDLCFASSTFSAENGTIRCGWDDDFMREEK